MKTTCTVDASSTTPVAQLPIEEHWDDVIALALNNNFVLNAEDDTLRRRPPFHPFMPLPWDRMVSECRDYVAYVWNKELIRYQRAFSEERYSDRDQSVEKLISIGCYITADSIRNNESNTEYLDVAKGLKEEMLHWVTDLEYIKLLLTTNQIE